MEVCTINFPQIILSNLLYNDIFTRKVIPYLKHEYFEDSNDRIVFDVISTFIQTYNLLPSKEAVYIDLSNVEKINDDQFEKCKSIINDLTVDPNTSLDWLVVETEKFCQKRAIYLALIQSLQIYDGTDKKFDLGSIPDILTNAIGITFDAHIGHDFIDDAAARWDFYHLPKNKIPFQLEILNEITKGGLEAKTMTILMAGPGVGKSFAMCDFAAKNLMDGKNVLYISLEMAEERIAQRIDENLLDLNVDDLLLMPKDYYLKRINNIKEKTPGRIKIKEYPTGSAGSSNFRALLRELKLKNNFVPDVIYIDYLNICCSSRLKQNVKASMYEYVKMVGEEIRGLSVEFNVPIVTATQFNREGYRSSDPGMDDVAESFGTSMTADYIWALVSSEELEKDNQLMFIQIKNRYNDVNKPKKFLVGIDRSKMQMYDVPSNGQTLVREKSETKNEMFITPEMSKKLTKDSFNDFV